VTASGVASWSAVSAGYATACAIGGGQLWCWGANGSGQIGDGTTAERTTPVRVGTSSDWVDVSTTGFTTCGVRESGGQRSLYCWGNGSGGAIGDGYAFRDLPAAVHRE
jgi:alpha-tubulin suppressor-like RCC1 family protein